jgi:epoxyqueuosine reductase
MKEVIRQKALELGFDACRFTSAAPPSSYEHYRSWLAEAMHGTMAYLERQSAQRGDPNLFLPGARSIIVLASNYATGDSNEPSLNREGADQKSGVNPGWIARYARYEDYHVVLGGRLRQLGDFIIELLGPAVRVASCVDAGPVLERDLAQRAGLGFIGRHTNLISRR